MAQKDIIIAENLDFTLQKSFSQKCFSDTIHAKLCFRPACGIFPLFSPLFLPLHQHALHSSLFSHIFTSGIPWALSHQGLMFSFMRLSLSCTSLHYYFQSNDAILGILRRHFSCFFSLLLQILIVLLEQFCSDTEHSHTTDTDMYLQV